MRIDTAAGSILCDPWVNPAYFASWFPFPDNSLLDWDHLGQVDYLYVSHLHRDHFDAAHLKRYVSKQATVLLPEFPTSEMEDELRALGFTKFLKTRSEEVVELDGGLKVMIQALTSPTDGPIGDSSLWVEYDGVRLLNQNDARPTDLSVFAELGHVHAHLLQFSGAIWYPMVYELPQAAKTAFGKQKRDRQFDRTWRYIDDLKASHVFPIAGPPCFLDDALWQFNDIHGDEGNIFPDQSVFMAEYAKVGGTNGIVLLPGSVAEVTTEGATTTHPVPVEEFFANKVAHLEEMRERKRPIIEAEKASWRHPEVDVLGQMKSRIEPLLDESIYLAKGSVARSASTWSATTARASSRSWWTSRQGGPAVRRREGPLPVPYRAVADRAPALHRRGGLGQLALPLLPVLGGPDRPVQRVRLRVLQVPVRGATPVRRGLVRRARAEHRRRGHHPRRLGRAAALPAPEGRPDPVRHRRWRPAHLSVARLAVRPAQRPLPDQRGAQGPRPPRGRRNTRPGRRSPELTLPALPVLRRSRRSRRCGVPAFRRSGVRKGPFLYTRR
ncbi:hypothetical protein GCM10027614_66170 [Micromonospora vulcania]